MWPSPKLLRETFSLVTRRQYSIFSKHQEDLMKRGLPKKKPIPGVANIVVVASGKGGVGKSTIAVNLAHGLRYAGYRVGILDADIFGPSIPRMMNLCHKPESTPEGLILPLLNHDIECMSIGFMVESGIFWRGLMVMSALETLLYKVKWDARDVLVIDMPPGTGDTHLSIAQRLELTGAVVVTTPQEVALIDAIKCVEMFSKVKVPILGTVINMCGFKCEKCGEYSDIFGECNDRELSERLGTDIIGKFPLQKEIRVSGDTGSCYVAETRDDVVKQEIKQLALRVGSNLTKSIDKENSH